MAITKSSLYSETFKQVKDFIDTNISDPTKRYKRKWIYASFPNITETDFQGYPFIVIESPDVSEEAQEFDNTRGYVFRILITVWSDDETETDELSDSILNQFRTNKSTLEAQGLHNFEIESSPFAIVTDEHGKKIFNRPIGIIGHGRM